MLVYLLVYLFLYYYKFIFINELVHWFSLRRSDQIKKAYVLRRPFSFLSFFIPIVTVFLREYDNSFFVLIDNF